MDDEEFQYYDESVDVSEASDELVTITVFYDLAAAERTKNFLEFEGFQVVATDWEGFEIDDLAAHIERGVNINVFSEDYYEAMMLLSQADDEQGLLRDLEIDNGWGNCPGCQSKNLVIIEGKNIEESLWTYVKTFFSLRRALHCNDCGYEWKTERK